ncbi:MAG: hypothetical protein WCJ19_02140 [bacterium]
MIDVNLNNTVSNQPVKKTNISKKEKIIIIVLAVIFVGVSLGAFWDLYGKNHVCFGDCVQRSEINNTTTPQNTKPTDSTKQSKQDNITVDSSLYAACTSKISDEKEYKTCCDSLTSDDNVKKACKKVVDDKVQQTTQPAKN